MKNSIKFKVKNVSDLIPYVNNSRTHSDEQIAQIAASIQEFGFTNPVLVGTDNVLIAGHGRVLAARKLRLKEVPCMVVDGLSETQRRALVLADNRLALSAGWNVEMLALEMKALDDEGYNMALTGFDEDEIAKFLTETTEGQCDEDEVPPIPEEPIAKLGDTWLLGAHRLRCGDSADITQIDALMAGEKADLVFTDPPYEMETKGGGLAKGAARLKQIADNKVDSFDPESLMLHAPTNVFCHNKPLIKKYIELAERNKQPFDLCFYKKTNTAPNYGGHLMTDTEYLIVIGRQGPNKGLPKETYSKCFIGTKDADNALSYSKPVALCEKFILLYAKRLVLDTFLGSGSTLIACEKLGKTCYAMEIAPPLVDVAIARWEKFTGKKAELENVKETKQKAQNQG